MQESGQRTKIERLTKQFRYDALDLCHRKQQDDGLPSSLAAESWQVAQHLLDQCWDYEKSEVNNANAVIYACAGCGADLHPGWNGTRLRVARFSALKAERTRRRRLLRKRRRLLLSQQKQAKDSNKLQQQKASETGNFDPLERLLLLEDPLLVFDRHHLKLQCGRCHAIVRLKGLKRESPPTKQTLQRKQARPLVVRHQAKMKESERKSSSFEDPSTATTYAVNDDEFLLLPPPVTAQPSNTPSNHSIPKQVRHQPTIDAQLLLQNPKKSKKNKKKGRDDSNKKSHLLNFLSSLND